MKKCILQLMIRVLRSFSVVGLFVVCHAYGMEKENDNFRLFANLPLNASNRVAHFLGWETKKAFAKRTARHYNRTLHYCNHVSDDNCKRVILEPGEDKIWPVSVTVFNMQRISGPKIIFNTLFPSMYRFTAFNFNHQGTHLLIRFSQYDSEDKEHKKRVFFDLNAVYKSRLDREREKREENALEEYLRHHLVCKKIT